MKTMLLIALTAAATLTNVAQAHTPFMDGPDTARQTQRSLNKAAAWDAVSCRYTRPHILCTGHVKLEPRTDVWYVFRMTVHKTAVRSGYAVACVKTLGVCRRYPMRFQT